MLPLTKFYQKTKITNLVQPMVAHRVSKVLVVAPHSMQKRQKTDNNRKMEGATSRVIFPILLFGDFWHFLYYELGTVLG